jgi:transposase
LPRERIVYPGPAVCPCCGDSRLRKIGEDVTETLELIPRQWKVIQHVREKFSCRTCEAISQPPAHHTRSRAGERGRSCSPISCSLSMACTCRSTGKSAVYAREGIDLDVSTLAGWVGAAAATLMPLVTEIRAHVFAAERILAEDTTVPGPGQGQDPYRPIMDLRARQPAFCRSSSAGGGTLLFARSWRRASRAAFSRLHRIDTGGRLCRVQSPLRD